MEPKYIFTNGVMSINPNYKPMDESHDFVENTADTKINKKVIRRPISHPKTSSSFVIQRLLMG